MPNIFTNCYCNLSIFKSVHYMRVIARINLQRASKLRKIRQVACHSCWAKRGIIKQKTVGIKWLYENVKILFKIHRELFISKKKNKKIPARDDPSSLAVLKENVDKGDKKLDSNDSSGDKKNCINNDESIMASSSCPNEGTVITTETAAGNIEDKELSSNDFPGDKTIPKKSSMDDNGSNASNSCPNEGKVPLINDNTDTIEIATERIDDSNSNKSSNKISQRIVPAKGLENIGNTCYMNSALQCVFRVDALCHQFQQKNVPQYNVSISFKKLIEELLGDKRKSAVKPSGIKFEIGRLYSQFAGYSQQDITQFMTILLDCLNQDFKKQNGKKITEKIQSESEIERYRSSCNSPIVNIFHGMLRSSLNCATCEYPISVNYEPFATLSVPLPVESYFELTVCVVNYQENKPLNYKLISLKMLWGSIYENVVEKLKLKHNENTLITIRGKGKNPFELVEVKDRINPDIEFDRKKTIIHFHINQSPKTNLILINGIRYSKGYVPFPIILNYDSSLGDISQLEQWLITWLELEPNGVRLETYALDNENLKMIELDVKSKLNIQHEADENLTTNQQATLMNCFQLLTNRERLSSDILIDCQKCEQERQVFKKFDIYALPDTLIVQLKRFTFFTRTPHKIDLPVDFPIKNLVLNQEIEPKSVSYNLIAVANHYGSLHGGHYTAYGKVSDSEKWHYFNDLSVCSVDNIHSENMNNAIVLVYQAGIETTKL